MVFSGLSLLWIPPPGKSLNNGTYERWSFKNDSKFEGQNTFLLLFMFDYWSWGAEVNGSLNFNSEEMFTMLKLK